MEETVVIRGLTRQAKMGGLPLPYFMAAVALTVVPFMIVKSLWWLPTFAIWYFGARSITAVRFRPRPRSPKKSRGSSH